MNPNNCNCHNQPEGNCQPEAPKTAEIGELPIDTIEALPDYILAERDVEDPATGDIKRSITRIPALKLFPSGNFDNVTIIEGNNPSIKPVEGQVIAGYLRNEGSRNIVYPANSSNKAQFLIIGKMLDGQLMIQNSGVINIVSGHRYIPGAQYYTGTNGEPVTASTTNQKLFIPLSSTKLLVNI